MSFLCPRCGDKNTQKVSMLYESGTRIGYHGDIAQSYLASKHAPPSQYSEHPFIGCLIPFLTLLSIQTLVVIAVMGLAVPWIAAHFGSHAAHDNAQSVVTSPRVTTQATQHSHPMSQQPSSKVMPILPKNTETTSDEEVIFRARMAAYCEAGILLLLVVALVRLFRKRRQEIYRRREYNQTVWPQLYQTWNSEFICFKCEKIFVPIESQRRE